MIGDSALGGAIGSVLRSWAGGYVSGRLGNSIADSALPRSRDYARLDCGAPLPRGWFGTRWSIGFCGLTASRGRNLPT